MTLKTLSALLTHIMNSFKSLYYIKRWHAIKSVNQQADKQAFIDITDRPGIDTPLMAVAAQCSLHISASCPLWLNVTSSIKPEVHNVAQRLQRRTEPRPQEIDTKHLVKGGPAIPEICSQTDRQTDAHIQTQYSAPPGQSNNIVRRE